MQWTSVWPGLSNSSSRLWCVSRASPGVGTRLRFASGPHFLSLVAAIACAVTMPIPPACGQTSPRSNASSASAQVSGKQAPGEPDHSGPVFAVWLDPAHGGADNGAMLAPDQPEKAYTLALALRLLPLLQAKGVRVVLARTSDIALDSNARAGSANRTQPAACILLHATSTGEGIHLFTSSLPPADKQVSAGASGRAFLLWKTAQASFETESLRLESDMNAALTHRHLPVLMTRTSMATLNSLACPAVAIEIAPRDARTPPSNPAYEQEVSQALVVAVMSWRNEWRQHP